MKRVIWITFFALMPLSSSASTFCFAEAAHEYAVPEELLRAIAQVESSNKPGAVNRNTNGSADYGLMQINSSWLTALAKWNITKDVLLMDACLNIKVGAWILANNIQRMGYNWDAIGAYNAGCRATNKTVCATKRNTYSNKVYRALMSIDVQVQHQNVATATPTIPTTPGIETIKFQGGA